MNEARARFIRSGDPQVRQVLQNLRLFLDGLRQDGVPLDPTHELLVQEMGLELLRRDEPLTGVVLKAHLKPILCSSIYDETAFERRWALLIGAEEKPAEITAAQLDQKKEADEARRRLRRAWWRGALVAAGMLALIAAAFFWATHPNSPLPVEPLTKGEPQKIAEQKPAPVPEKKPEAPKAPVEKPKASEETVPLPVGVDWSKESYPPEDLFPRWETPDRRPAWIASGLAGLGILGLVLFVGGWAESLHLRRGRPGPDDQTEKLWLDLERPERNLAHLLKSVAHRLRQHEAVATQRWDPLRTVQETIRNGGILHPVRASRPESPEYLVFVQHWHREDHWQQLGREWLNALRVRGVAVTEVGFNQHPGQAWWTETSEPVSLRELRARFPRHRILVLGEDLETSSSFTGKRHPWINDLSDWETARIILTPPGEETDDWVREMREVDDWLVVPLAPDGLDRLAAWLGGDNSSGRALRSPGAKVPATFVANEKAWLSPRRPFNALVENGLLDLKAWLGAHGMAWLRACAVYPELNWHLTQYLGLGLERRNGSASAGAEDDAVLWKLSQLPWFRKGRMPGWWRSSLLDGFSAEEKRHVRSLLLAAMVRDGQGKRLYSLDYVTRHPRRVGWRGRWQVRNLRGPARKRLDEAVCARVLGDRFSVKIPFLGERRISFQFLGSLLLLASAAAVALPNWKAFIPDDRAPFPYITPYELPRDPGSPRERRLSWTLRHPSGIVFRWAPPGSFRMGEPEVKGRRVELTHGFWIATTEVTEWQWRHVSADRGMSEYLADSFEWKDLIDGSFWQVLASSAGRGWEDFCAALAGRWLTVTHPAQAVGGAMPRAVLYREAREASGNLIQSDSNDLFGFSRMERKFSLGEQTDKVTCVAIGSIVRVIPGEVTTEAVVSPSGGDDTLATGSEDGTIKLWNAESGEEVATLKGHSGEVTSLAWSSDAKYLASTSRDRTVKLWDPETHTEKATFSGHQAEVTCVAFELEGDSEIVASGSRDGAVKLWEPGTGKEIATLEGHSAGVTSLLLMGDDLLSGSEDGTIKGWSVKERKETEKLEEKGGKITSLAAGAWGQGHDGVLAAGFQDGRIVIWGDSDRKIAKIATLECPGGAVTSLSFLGQDESILAAGSSDGTLWFWDSTSNKPRKTLKLSAGVRSLALASDLTTLAIASANGVEIWDTAQTWISRLPTEAQWEYALRAGLEAPDANVRPESGWNGENSGGRAHPVAQKPANPWGLYDMTGNLQEWCRDWFGPLEPGENIVDPYGPASGDKKVLRGASFESAADQMKADSRLGGAPFDDGVDRGFRPVIVPRTEFDEEEPIPSEPTFDQAIRSYDELIRPYQGLEPVKGMRPIPEGYVNLLPLRIANAARDHIVNFETGGRDYFEKMYQRPNWPGYASGVVVGFGYDLGYHTKEEIRRDWEGIASPHEILAMIQVAGVTGSSAQYRAAEIKSQVYVDWEKATKVFERVTLPEWSVKTSLAYMIGRGDLHPLCNGALIGNTFNRGEAMRPDGKQREKWLIRESIRRGNLDIIPVLLREQAKYWPETAGTGAGPLGLAARRNEEAVLFQTGLDAMKQGPWPPSEYAKDDVRSTTGRTYGRNDIVGANHPIWTNGELHPGLMERKERILGIGREGLHCKKIRAGALYAVSAAAYEANALGYQTYVTSGNRWGVSTSPNHGQNGGIGDCVDFVVTTRPGGQGDPLPASPEGMQATYDILAAAVVAGANGIGWGRGNGAGHHVEVDDAQRGEPGVEDVWPYTDEAAPEFLRFEKDFADGTILKNPKYAKFRDFVYTVPDPKGAQPIAVPPAQQNEIPGHETGNEPAMDSPVPSPVEPPPPPATDKEPAAARTMSGEQVVQPPSSKSAQTDSPPTSVPIAFPVEPPLAVPATLKEADAKLNEIYKAVIRKLTSNQKQEFIEIQKDWLRYRDAAKSVAEIVNNSVGTEVVIFITVNRTNDFERLLSVLDNPNAPIPVKEADASAQAHDLETKLGNLFDTIRFSAPAKIQEGLAVEQRAWAAYRDLDVAFLRSLSTDESLRLILHHRERIYLARPRTRWLEELKAKLPAAAPSPVPTPAPPATPTPRPARASASLPGPRDYVNTRPLRVANAGLEHIAKFETGGRVFWESKYQRPQWPGYSSGVTVGFGYDLGYHTKDEIRTDWKGVASEEEIAAMVSVAGVTGNRAQNLASSIQSKVLISWEKALQVFTWVTLQEWGAKTSKAYRIGRGDLHPLCNAALIGNTFNRGEAISPEGRGREKYLIREALRSENYSVIPSLFREQRKYWPGTSGPIGLQTRRSEEADLFQQGLDAMKAGYWPPASYKDDDVRSSTGRTYLRNDIVGSNHPIWTNGELHPGLIERKERILGIGREGQHCHRIRAGVLYAVSAAAYQANALGYQFYITSGNRWGVSTSPNHGQNGDLGDTIDFVITTEAGGQGSTADASAKGLKDTYDILAAAVAAGANGIGWGRANGAGHHVEVDDQQRPEPKPEDVWPFTDESSPVFLSFKQDFLSRKIQTNPAYAQFHDFVYRGPDPRGVKPAPLSPAQLGKSSEESKAPQD